MTTTPTTEFSSADQLKEEFVTLTHAGVGITIIRTSEEPVVLEALMELSVELETAHKWWNCVEGWSTPATNGNSTPEQEQLTNPVEALMVIGGAQEEGENLNPEQEWPGGIYAMQDLHEVVEDSVVVRRCLKLYAERFKMTEQRLVLIAPLGFSVPMDLQADVYVLDHALPSQHDLESLLEDTVTATFVDHKGNPLEFDNPFDEDATSRIVSACAGMTHNEAETAISTAIVQIDKDWPEKVDVDAFIGMVLEHKTQVVKRSQVLEVMPSVSMDEVGGLEYYKQWIVERKAYLTPEAREFGVDMPKGCLVLGPPGTGKSLVAKATSSALGVPLIRFDVSALFGSLVGQTEERVRMTLKQLQAMAPCTVLLDEIDKAGIDPRQAGGDSGTSARVIGNILTFMQENEAPIFWVLSANRIQSLPPELLRKGRLDENWYVSAPNAEERRQIIEIHLRKRGQPIDIDAIEVAVECTQGFVGAEIEAAVAEAVGKAFLSKAKRVTGHTICEQVANMVPGSKAFAKDIGAMKRWAADNARPASRELSEGEDAELLGAIDQRREARSKHRRVRPQGRKRQDEETGEE